MNALELLQLATQVVWVGIAVVIVVRAFRRPTRTNADIALFFFAIGSVLVYSRLAAVFELPAEQTIGFVAIVALMAAPYLLLRLVNDFAGVPAPIQGAAVVGLGISVAFCAWLVYVEGTSSAQPLDPTRVVVTLYLVAYFAALAVYCAARFVRLAGGTQGVTRRRMQAVAAGSYFLGVTLLLAGLGGVATVLAPVTGALTQVCFFASAIAYAIGFAPPTELRRYWQIPEFRGFIARASTLPRLTLPEIVDDLAGVAGRALGARATIGLFDEARGVLRFRDPHAAIPEEIGPSKFLAWRAFSTQTPIYAAEAAAVHAEHADTYRRAGVGPVLIAPITAGERRLGVLEVFASREPIFAEDDLAFVQLMAQQAAVLIESRQLIDDAARVQAQEETVRLKEDFVSAAAHDLKTPLTTIMAQAQLLERRAEREGRTSELTGIRRLVRESQQLSRLVDELLDASRLERGALLMDPEPVDLAALAREVAARDRPGAERVELNANGALRGSYDPERMRQLMDNLVENALKYSPAESPVVLKLWGDDGKARIAVADQGIGIPPEDLPYVFDRFRRGSNVDHRRFSGIGLGLYICRGIVEQHGGRIWVESAPGRGTTFNVELPEAVDAERTPRPATVSAS